MSAQGDERRALLARAVAGDKTALQLLLIGCFGVIEATVRSQFPSDLADKVDPLDVVQDVLVDVHVAIGDFQGDDPAGFVAWVRQIAVNRLGTAVRHYNRQKRGGGVQRIDVQSPADDSVASVWDWVFAKTDPPDRPARGEETREALYVCLAQLHEDQRTAVMAHYFDHLDANQIAERMGRTPGAVRELLRRARAHLEKLLGSASIWLSSR